MDIFNNSRDSFVGYLKKIVFSKFKKVKLKRIDLRNVLNYLMGSSHLFFQNQGVLKNYIENELVIENSKDNLLIHNLVVDNISVSDYLYEDITIQMVLIIYHKI